MTRFLFFFVGFSLQHAHGEVFSNSYISFQPISGWICSFENPVTICRHSVQTKAKEAVMIIAAKRASPEDSLAIYKNYLARPINNISIKTHRPFQSEVKTLPSETKLGGHYWIDSLHYNSEIEDYLTRYVATVKDNVAILVTFSVHKNYYTQYSRDFNLVLKSITAKNQPKFHSRTSVNNQPTLLNPQINPGIKPPTTDPVGGTPAIQIPLIPPEKKTLNLGILFFAVALALIGILLLKKRKKK